MLATEYSPHSKAWCIYSYFKRLHLTAMLRFLYGRWYRRLTAKLLSSHPSLLYLEVYKLLYIAQTEKKCAKC